MTTNILFDLNHLNHVFRKRLVALNNSHYYLKASILENIRMKIGSRLLKLDKICAVGYSVSYNGLETVNSEFPVDLNRLFIEYFLV